MNKLESRNTKSETNTKPGKDCKFETHSRFRISRFEFRASSLFRISNFALRVSQASALVFLMLSLTPSRAAAHLVTTGMGPVYDGIGHLLLTPEDLVPVLAIALYAGLRGAVAGRRTMFLLPVAWFVGGLAGTRVSNFESTVTTATSLPIPAISFFILGGLVAADLWMPAGAVTALAIALGLVHGFLNGAALRDGAGTLGLIGIMTMLFVLVTVISACVVSLGKPWARIAVRVAGSWIAAIGLLAFGWAMR
jgi:hydrogenase/urease accessory protein HupE